MQSFRSLVQFLTAGSLVLAAAQIYLTINKVWKRKHEHAVAESISIIGEFVGLVPLIFLTTTFVLDMHWAGAVDGVLWMMANGIMITIGSGLWVERRRGSGFWTLLRESVRLERGEVGALARSLFRPASASKILEILSRLALIDGHLNDRERTFIATFADNWGIRFSPDAVPGDVTGPAGCMTLRRGVAEFLATSPPAAQVRRMPSVITALAQVDGQVNTEKSIIIAELEGMWNAYLGKSRAVPLFSVALVPQSLERDTAIKSVLPHALRAPLQGGEAYVEGRYHSEAFAEMVGAEYRALNIFTTVVRLNGPPPADALTSAVPSR